MKEDLLAGVATVPLPTEGNLVKIEESLGAAERAVAELKEECDELALAMELGDADALAKHVDRTHHLNLAQQRVETLRGARAQMRRRHEAALADRDFATRANWERAYNIEADAAETEGRAALAAFRKALRQVVAAAERNQRLVQRVKDDCPAAQMALNAWMERMRSAIAWEIPADFLPRQRPEAQPECPAARFRRDLDADLRRAGIIGRLPPDFPRAAARMADATNTHAEEAA